MKKGPITKQISDHSQIKECPRQDFRSCGQIPRVLQVLEKTYPDAHCALHFRSPFQLLVATILSAQCTDIRVNQVTEALFSAFPDVNSLAAAKQAVLEEIIRSTGFFRNKARNLIACARTIRQRHGGRVPATLEELTELPGVGRKTANVVLGNAFGIPGVVVDTHVKRIAFRLGWTAHTDPDKIEKDLAAVWPQEKWVLAGHLLIFHGRRICKAPVPQCSECPVAAYCPQKGVKKSR